ncbi:MULTISPECIES: hypothetical protein [unclassified Paenibacillus]|uniref:hypothetical protein n=1 Tax=unclassified Paenibacillus TaxID=185978 RepID=UPI000AC32B9F|nr:MULTISPECIES: hypothetical protein [unclassified Paenibacillus]
MDKRKVIQAYKLGIISIQECAQILGLDSGQLPGLLKAQQFASDYADSQSKRTVNS